MISRTLASSHLLLSLLLFLLHTPTPTHSESCVVDCSFLITDPHCGTNGQTYRNRCELYNAVCLSGGTFTEQGKGKCDATPDSIATLSVIAKLPNLIEVRWQPSLRGLRPTSYKIHHRRVGDSQWYFVFVPGYRTVAVITKIKPETTYEVYIVPYHETTAGPQSDVVTVTTPQDTLAPRSVAKLIVDTRRGNAIRVSWSARGRGTKATHFRIYYRRILKNSEGGELNSGEYSFVVVFTPFGVLRGLLSGADYEIYVVPYNKGIPGPKSSLVVIHTPGVRGRDGGWGSWSVFTDCTQSCGGGEQVSFRVCDSPPASNDGRQCLLSNTNDERGEREEKRRVCNVQVCPVAVDGYWGQWSYFTICSKSCGRGQQSRYRMCNSPAASNGGLECLMTNRGNQRGKREEESRYCNTDKCPVPLNGNWGQWSYFTSCSKSCGRGEQIRYRVCNSPAAANGGRECLVSNTRDERGKQEEQSRYCNTNSCPVPLNGNWGQWSYFTTCSKSCGRGQQSRYRVCNSPAAANGGRECLISNTRDQRGKREEQNRYCNTKSCPVSRNGNWGQWSSFTTCSKSCGRGQQSRYRVCNRPTAANGGRECLISNTRDQRGKQEEQNRYCNSNTCPVPVNGDWGQWSYFTTCSKSCGRGQQSRYRVCNSPAAANGGRECLISNTRDQRGKREEQNRYCNTKSCPVSRNGNWGQWSYFTTCSKSCGRGQQSRYRVCNSPAAANGGRECLISNTRDQRGKREEQNRYCNSKTCPVSRNGNWGQWSYFSTCSKTCGRGQQSRYRVCNSPAAANGGRECLISNTRDQRGKREEQNRYCNSNTCPVPVNGDWGQWSYFTTCSKSCGRGQQSRYRVCNSPAAANGGRECLISNTRDQRGKREEQNRYCNSNTCPVSRNGNWGQWSFFTACSKSCGRGQQSRYRVCNSPAAANGGRECLISNTRDQRGKREEQNRYCNSNTCLVSRNGDWGQWSFFTTCSKSCGRGQQSRYRVCNSPAARNGGLQCKLSTSNARGKREDQNRVCNSHVCPSPTNGNWGRWSGFSACSKSCGSGVRTRHRLCNNPSAANGGLECMLSHGDHRGKREEQKRYCKRGECYADMPAVHGNWGRWRNIGTCSKSCGGGYQIRVRTCDNPGPSNGGLKCIMGKSEASAAQREKKPPQAHMMDELLSPIGLKRGMRERSVERCNTKSCPRNGGYSKWSSFSRCSVSCGRGVKTRERKCNNPTPLHGGKDCRYLGRAKETKSCQMPLCIGAKCERADHVYCDRYSSPERTRRHYCKQRWTRENCPAMCRLCRL